MTIGDRIKSRRMELNISQTELATKTNSSKQTIYKYENNIITNIPSDKIELIANILETTPEYIMGWTDSLKKEQTIESTLLPREQRLLDDFRNLNTQGQEYILQTMDMVKDRYKKIDSFSKMENVDAG